MEETPDLEQRRSPWQTVVAVAVIVLTLAAVFGLVAYRYYGSQPHRVTGSVVGSVQVVPGFNVKCSLPVTANGRTAAMISLPDGTVTVDNSVAPGPGGKGVAMYSFDAPLQKWVPVQRQWVSPDGRYYAFSTSTTGVPGEAPAADLRIREISSGKDRTAWKGQGNASVIGWSGSTVYFVLQGMFMTYGAPMSAPEVWAADAAGGNAHRVGPNPPPPAPEPGKPAPFSFGGFGYIGGGGIWSVTASKIPETPAPGSMPTKPMVGGPDTIMRMDLGTGAVSSWYTAPDGTTVGLAGLDGQGRPIVTQSDFIKFKMAATPPPPGFMPPPPSYFVLTGKGQTSPITVPNNVFGLGPMSSDSHGSWFTAPGQIWLLSSGKFTKVADVPEQLFPAPTPPPGAVVPPKPATSAIVQMPIQKGPFLQIAGACA
jgi:hypothetical protein